MATIAARYDARHALDSTPLADPFCARQRLRLFAPAVGRVRLGVGTVGVHVDVHVDVDVRICRFFLDGRGAVGRRAAFAGG